MSHFISMRQRQTTMITFFFSLSHLAISNMAHSRITFMVYCPIQNGRHNYFGTKPYQLTICFSGVCFRQQILYEMNWMSIFWNAILCEITNWNMNKYWPITAKLLSQCKWCSSVSCVAVVVVVVISAARYYELSSFCEFDQIERVFYSKKSI